jgi:hypothetical protein
LKALITEQNRNLTYDKQHLKGRAAAKQHLKGHAAAKQHLKGRAAAREALNQATLQIAFRGFRTMKVVS